MSKNVDMTEAIPMDEVRINRYLFSNFDLSFSQSSNKIHQQKEDDDHHRQCIDELRTIFLQVHRYQQEPDQHVGFEVYLFE